MLPPVPSSSACFVRALSLTSISAFTYLPAVVLVTEIVVQRISGPFDVMYGSLETLAAYCGSKCKMFSQQLGVENMCEYIIGMLPCTHQESWECLINHNRE
jgi:hypothetical protein